MTNLPRIAFLDRMRELGVSDDDILACVSFCEEAGAGNDAIDKSLDTFFILFIGASTEERKLLLDMVKKKGE